jgi:hypothetical protein
VLPVVAMVLTLALMLGGAAVLQATVTTDTAQRDVNGHKAMQAAEAGLDMAQYRMNTLSLDLRSLLDLSPPLNLTQNLKTQCVAQVSGQLAIRELSAGQWCGASETEALGNGASFTYEISPVAVLDLDASTTPGQETCAKLYPVPPLSNLVNRTLCGANLNSVLYNVQHLDKVLERRIVSTGMAGPGCPTGPRCVKRRVYSRFTLEGAADLPVPTGTLSGLLGLIGSLLTTLLNNLGSDEADVTFGLYERAPDSFRECSPVPPSTPDSGC